MKKKDAIFDAPPDGFLLEPVHPGEVLQEEIAARGLSAHALALKLRVPANRLTEIISGKRGISTDTALRLSRYLGPGAAFWLNLQSQYDLAMAEKRLGAKSGRRSRRRRKAMQPMDLGLTALKGEKIANPRKDSAGFGGASNLVIHHIYE